MVVITGMISQYSEGRMERTVAYRQHKPVEMVLPVTLPEVDGYVAVRDCPDIGNRIELHPAGQSHWETFLVADCVGSDEVRAWMDGHNMWDLPILAEVDYPTALRWSTVGRMQPGEMRITHLVEVGLDHPGSGLTR
jgi:hypothetical protein